jgi:hypothetical protein
MNSWGSSTKEKEKDDLMDIDIIKKLYILISMVQSVDFIMAINLF